MPDVMTEKLRSAADSFRFVAGMNDQQIAELIRADQIDVLVDLSLHSAHNRMMVFARKPAPVQVTYLAYCSTSGMEQMDYRITDPWICAGGVGADPRRGAGFAAAAAHLRRQPSPARAGGFRGAAGASVAD
jgi:hypothetical protein